MTRQNNGRPLTVEDVQIKTATVEVKAIVIGKRQLTLSVFRQLPKVGLVRAIDGPWNDVLPDYEPWGVVNYHWDGCGYEGMPRSPHTHVVGVRDGRLCRSCVGVPCWDAYNKDFLQGDPNALEVFARLCGSRRIHFSSQSWGRYWYYRVDRDMRQDAEAFIKQWLVFHASLTDLRREAQRPAVTCDTPDEPKARARRGPAVRALPLPWVCGSVLAMNDTRPPNGVRGEPELDTSPTSLRCSIRAALEEWPITPQVRQRCVQEALKVLDDPRATTYHRLLALKVLGLYDTINVRREASARAERSASTAQQASVLKALSWHSPEEPKPSAPRLNVQKRHKGPPRPHGRSPRTACPPREPPKGRGWPVLPHMRGRGACGTSHIFSAGGFRQGPGR
jgi:hypothetical protein